LIDVQGLFKKWVFVAEKLDQQKESMMSMFNQDKRVNLKIKQGKELTIEYRRLRRSLIYRSLDFGLLFVVVFRQGNKKSLISQGS
jgi:hypothetical protein